jgi:N-acetyl-gamma-glutamyl-phosphate reductase
VGPYTRGILSTITVHLKEIFDVAPLYARYAAEPFVRVLGEGKPAEIRYVRGSNFCDIGWVMDKRTMNLVIVSAIDNLVGGTAGMAVQCMNLMFGLEETTGLKLAGMMP